MESDEGRINTAIPEYEDLPELRDVDGLGVWSDERRENYFKGLLNGDIRVRMINGMVSDFDFYSLFCDYCGTMMIDHNDSNKPYYYCMDCCLDMCNLCYHETSSDVAKANGAKNYEKRQEKLAKCRTHRLSPRYMLDDSNDDNLERLWNGLEIGSMLDWVPVYQGDEYDLVLLNCNKNSNLLGRIALVSEDDHGRNGYYTFPEDWTLERVQETLEQYHREPLKYDDGSKLNGWDEYYNSPIKRLMASLNMPVHYG